MLQLPALSRVRRWNHQSPSGSVWLLVDEPDVSFTVSGAVEACGDHRVEYPSTPLPPAAAPAHVMSTVGSFDHCPGVWLELVTVGFDGGVASIRKGPRWTAPLHFPPLSRLR